MFVKIGESPGKDDSLSSDRYYVAQYIRNNWKLQDWEMF